MNGQRVRIVARPETDAGRTTDDNLPTIRPADVFIAETDRLKKVIAGMGLRAADAEDVLQAVSVKCLNRDKACLAPTFVNHQQCLRWLIQVTTNECINEHRRRSRFRRQASAIADHRPQSQEDCPMDNAMLSERFEAVQEALRGLDDNVLEPLVLKYFCDLSSAEIGDILGMPAPTVRVILCRARMALAKSLMKRGIER